MPNFIERGPVYRKLWQSMTITRPCEQAARKVIAGRSHYEAVEKETGVPWFFIGLAHLRESGCNFAGVLHNGEHIIGNGQKTRLVPKGRGPFFSWSEAAIDAIKLKALHIVEDWSIERLGYEFERFNGFGYVGRGINSPYVWAGSNHYTIGKYVADGKFDPHHVDKQLGAMPVLATLCKMLPDVRRRVNGGLHPDVTGQVAGGGGVVAIGIQQGWGVPEFVVAFIFVAVGIAVTLFIINKRRKKRVANLPPITNIPELVEMRGGAAVEEN